MNRHQKKIALEKLKPLFENVHFYIVDTKGLGAEQIYKLRVMMMEANVFCKVVPNTLLSILFQGTPYEELKSTLKQSSMVCFSKEDPGAPAKSIKKFRKEEDTTSPDFKGGWIIEQAFLSDEKFEYLVNLKSKEEMIAEILGLLQGPSAQLLGVIKSSQETLCRALEAVKKQ